MLLERDWDAILEERFNYQEKDRVRYSTVLLRTLVQ